MNARDWDNVSVLNVRFEGSMWSFESKRRRCLRERGFKAGKVQMKVTQKALKHVNSNIKKRLKVTHLKEGKKVCLDRVLIMVDIIPDELGIQKGIFTAEE